MVTDTATGDVAQINDAAQTGLSLEDADDLADLLNRIDRERPKRTS